MTALDRLSQIIPADIALANKALATSLKGITGINNTTLPTFAQAVSKTETLVGLPLVNAETSAVSPSTASYYSSTLAGGSSVNGTYVIADFLGTAAGLPGTALLTDTLAIFATMDLSYLTLIYQTMVNVLNGTYNKPDVTDPTYNDVVIPAGLPGAGTYLPVLVTNPTPPPAYLETVSAASEAMTVLIAEANAEIVSLVTTYPTQTTKLNQDWNEMAHQLVQEPINQAKANLVWSQLIPNSQQTILSLIQNLPDIGQDKVVGGQAQFFELLADITTLAGQAIIGIFRQGPTATALRSAGILTSNNIPADPNPPPPQANLGPTSY
jgi:hypothetical protein